MLLEKNQITDYELKSKILFENGWENYYHDDNWIKTQWMKDGLPYDKMGISTDEAYEQVSNEEKIIL